MIINPSCTLLVSSRKDDEEEAWLRTGPVYDAGVICHASVNITNLLGSSWEEYVVRVELCCAANKLVTDIDKRAALLSCWGQDTYSLISTLFRPLRLPSVEYRTIVDAVKNHVNPTPSERLRKLPLSIMLRDRLVFVLADGVFQQRLLAEKSLTFEAAYDLAVSYKQQKDIGSKRSDKESKEDVTARVSTPSKERGMQLKADASSRFHRCMGYHDPGRCKFKNAICFACSGKGHISRVCKAKVNVQSSHPVEDCSNVTMCPKHEYDELLKIKQIKNSPERILVTVQILGENVTMEVDSGAARSIISVQEFNKLKAYQSVHLEHSETKLVTWTRGGLDVLGKAMMPVNFKKKSLVLPLLVAANKKSTLLGRDRFSSLGIQVTCLQRLFQELPYRQSASS
ncbi:uncharacterized protein LOC120845928 [Ixodes scapularis]|uniref:uncharacterized protein LOC120845928 n=1 Tax=Ixodes scapularis TaxID=6945 RepID=UPI001A9D93DA|nr:uncharacterized protein LOC120845928 [Ixodes scapularis]